LGSNVLEWEKRPRLSSPVRVHVPALASRGNRKNTARNPRENIWRIQIEYDMANLLVCDSMFLPSTRSGAVI